jgi:FMN phosphatase YigB (HAD superfamily)
MQTLLLDFDGVVLRNPKIAEYQYRKSAAFLQKYTNLSYNRCLEINNKYYPQYGHTVIFINKIFTKKTTLEEYNDFVFNTNAIKKLDNLIDFDTYEHANKFKDLISLNNTYIFTNAHINWIEYFSYKLDLFIPYSKIIYPTDISMLKPFPQVYENLDQKIDNNIVFVDDSIKNLEYPMRLPKWDVCLFKDASDVDLIHFKLKHWYKSYI